MTTDENGRWSSLPPLVPVASTVGHQLVDEPAFPGPGFGLGPGGGGDADGD